MYVTAKLYVYIILLILNNVSHGARLAFITSAGHDDRQQLGQNDRLQMGCRVHDDGGELVARWSRRAGQSDDSRATRPCAKVTSYSRTLCAHSWSRRAAIIWCKLPRGVEQQQQRVVEGIVALMAVTGVDDCAATFAGHE